MPQALVSGHDIHAICEVCKKDVGALYQESILSRERVIVSFTKEKLDLCCFCDTLSIVDTYILDTTESIVDLLSLKCDREHNDTRERLDR